MNSKRKFLVNSLIYLIGICNSIELNLPIGSSEFDVTYTSVLTLDTPFNPNYTYFQRREEYISLTLENNDDNTYDLVMQTDRFFSNISEYQREDRVFDSDINYSLEEKQSNPIFSTTVQLLLDNKGTVIQEPDIPADYTPSIALHFITMLYNVTKDHSINDIVSIANNNKNKNKNKETKNKKTSNKWEVILPMPREKGYYEIFDAFLKPKKPKPNDVSEGTEDTQTQTQTVSILKGRLQDTDFDETINDAKIKGYFKFDVDTGLITKFKLHSSRDVDDPKMGFHSLKEDMILTIKPSTGIRGGSGRDSQGTAPTRSKEPSGGSQTESEDDTKEEL